MFPPLLVAIAPQDRMVTVGQRAERVNKINGWCITMLINGFLRLFTTCAKPNGSSIFHAWSSTRRYRNGNTHHTYTYRSPTAEKQCAIERSFWKNCTPQCREYECECDVNSCANYSINLPTDELSFAGTYRMAVSVACLCWNVIAVCYVVAVGTGVVDQQSINLEKGRLSCDTDWVWFYGFKKNVWFWRKKLKQTYDAWNSSFEFLHKRT